MKGDRFKTILGVEKLQTVRKLIFICEYSGYRLAKENWILFQRKEIRFVSGKKWTVKKDFSVYYYGLYSKMLQNDEIEITSISWNL